MESVRAPLVTVLIPVYGSAATLRPTLESLRGAQRPARFATLVIDDGSEPPLAPELAPQAERYAPLGLRIERLPRNQGIVAALNRGLALARAMGADYVARLDAGDTVAPQRFVRQLRLLEAQPDLGVVGSDLDFVDEAGRPLFRFTGPRSDAETRRRMHVNTCLPHTSVMLRLSALDGEYSYDYPAAEDYELFWRILGRARGLCIAEPLTTTVATAGGISLARRRSQLRSRLRLQWKHFDPARPESYLGIAMTLLFFLVPAGMVTALKNAVGTSRY
jgi:glycosyltransferase involved in cell wall biosynthesis